MKENVRVHYDCMTKNKWINTRETMKSVGYKELTRIFYLISIDPFWQGLQQSHLLDPSTLWAWQGVPHQELLRQLWKEALCFHWGFHTPIRKQSLSLPTKWIPLPPSFPLLLPIGHFGLLKDVNISFFLLSYHNRMFLRRQFGVKSSTLYQVMLWETDACSIEVLALKRV